MPGVEQYRNQVFRICTEIMDAYRYPTGGATYEV